MEYLDIVDENGVPTGKTAERTAAHKQGLRHRTSHVWILRERAGKVEVLLQKRFLSGLLRYFQRRTYPCRGRFHSVCAAGVKGRTGLQCFGK